MKLKPMVFAILSIGVTAIVVGGAMAALRWHIIIGLVGIVGGIILVAGAGVMAFLGRKPVGLEPTRVSTLAPSRGGLRKPVIAIVLVIAIGVGTFYGTSLLSSGASLSSTTTSSISQTSTSRTSTSFTSPTKTGTGTHTNFTGYTTTTSSSSHSSSSSSTSSSSVNEIFVISAPPQISPNGVNATLTAAYVNKARTNVVANVYITTYFANGTEYFSGTLFYPTGVEVPPGIELRISQNIGPFPPGKYSADVYIVDSTLQQISRSTTLAFTIR